MIQNADVRMSEPKAVDAGDSPENLPPRPKR